MLVEKEEEIISIIGKLKNSSKLWVDTEIANWKDRKNASVSLIQILPESKETSGAGVDKLLKQVIMLDVLGKPKAVQTFIDTIMKNEKIEKVFHNRSFDLQFLGQKEALNVSCTLANARKIPKDLLKSENLKLATLVTLFYPEVKVSKDEQQSDWAKRPLSEDQVKYAYLDPVYLAMIDGKLTQFAKDHAKEVDELAQSLAKIRLEKKETVKTEKVKTAPVLKEKKVVEKKEPKKPVEKKVVEKKEPKEKKERIVYSVPIQSLVQSFVDGKVDLNFEIRLTKAMVDQFAEKKIVIKDLKSGVFKKEPRVPKEKKEITEKK